MIAELRTWGARKHRYYAGGGGGSILGRLAKDAPGSRCPKCPVIPGRQLVLVNDAGTARKAWRKCKLCKGTGALPETPGYIVHPSLIRTTGSGGMQVDIHPFYGRIDAALQDMPKIRQFMIEDRYIHNPRQTARDYIQRLHDLDTTRQRMARSTYYNHLAIAHYQIHKALWGKYDRIGA